LVAIVAVVALGGCSAAASGKAHTASTAAVTTTSRATTSSQPVPSRRRRPPRLDDGSLGNRATRLACTLLSRAEIRSRFGGPVGVATPTYPYCQWLVGSNAFLALAVEPGVSFNAATQYVDTLQTVTGLGQQAIIANNRYLYFTASGTSYWLLWQQVGDFTELNANQLVALGHDVLAHNLATGPLPAPALGPAGPPIYFAGDSTAAGPEWAWGTYHATTPALRTLSEYQVGSGLVVPGYFDWPRHLLAVVAARRPRLVIYMGSANDGQNLLVNGAVQVIGSRIWRANYAARVGSTMASLVRDGARVLWIGEPAMQDPQLSADMQVIDEIYAAEAAKHPGVTFLNPGAVLNGPGGSYTGTLLIDGQPTQVRLDGIHLNTAGSIVLANYIAPFVARILGLGAATAATG
jgi:lysophospholipase L1-like esterase